MTLSQHTRLSPISIQGVVVNVNIPRKTRTKEHRARRRGTGCSGHTESENGSRSALFSFEGPEEIGQRADEICVPSACRPGSSSDWRRCPHAVDGAFRSLQGTSGEPRDFGAAGTACAVAAGHAAAAVATGLDRAWSLSGRTALVQHAAL